jgi:hypothetical protein
VKENHPSAMYSSGIDPERCTDVDSLMNQVSNGWMSGLTFYANSDIDL